METLGYGAFSQSLHRDALAARAPLNVTIEVTRRCPLMCAHCYNNVPMGDRRARLDELTTAEHCRILDELAAAGCLWLLYTGGEIFARKDFLDIYTHARRNGLLVTLFTNGTLVTEPVADYLAEWRPFAVEITLYGRTRDTFERVTGVAGSYDRAMRGVERLLARGLPLKLKTVALTLNRHEVREMQRFAEDLGVEFRFDQTMNPRIDCSQSPLAVRLTPEECVAFDVQDSARMADWRLFAQQFLRPVHPPELSHQLYHCGGGVDSFAVNPYGEMSICVLSQRDTYDLRTGSVREGWETFLRRLRDTRPVTRATKCTACELKAMCGMCPANGELENGDPEAPVDFLCQVAHLRAHAFGLPVAPHGHCEYCEGGDGYERLMDAAARLTNGTPAVAEETSTGAFLPMLASVPPEGGAAACGSGACSSCGSSV